MYYFCFILLYRVTITATATDESSLKGTSTQIITLRVVDTEAPTIGTIENQTVDNNQEITSIPVNVSDNSSDGVTVTVTGLPDGVVYADGNITGTPNVIFGADEETKPFTVTVTAKDASGNTATETFTITVNSNASKYEPILPSDKVVVDNPTNLTDAEKAAVKEAVEKANEGNFPAGTTVEVGADGTATITYPDGSQDTLSGNDLVEGKTDAAKITPNLPSDKVVVDNPTNLTDAEKANAKELPSTGDEANSITSMIGLALLGMAVLTYGEKRRKKD
ncbi:putative Ig domain-containing protein [Streptococcus suis]